MNSLILCVKLNIFVICRRNNQALFARDFLIRNFFTHLFSQGVNCTSNHYKIMQTYNQSNMLKTINNTNYVFKAIFKDARRNWKPNNRLISVASFQLILLQIKVSLSLNYIVKLGTANRKKNSSPKPC